MKKVLILAYDFPPYVSVGGLRPYNWYSYLKEYNIEPIVITRQWANDYGNELDYVAPSKSDKTIVETSDFGTIIQTPYTPNLANRILLKHKGKKHNLLRKLISFYFEIVQFLWVSGPKKQIYKEANQFLKNNKVDAIVATGDPYVLLHFASKLSRKFKTPWIADYRDPWSSGVSMNGNFLYRSINRFFEKRALRNVAAITTVSEFFKREIEALGTQNEIHIIENGYNPEKHRKG